MFHFPLNRCKRLQGCCWRARCSTCPSSSTPPSPPRALRPRPQLCERRRKYLPLAVFVWQRLPSRENSTANRSQLVENLFDDQLKTCWKQTANTTCWKPVETANEPVENHLSQLKTRNCKCSLLKMCWWAREGKIGWKGGWAAQTIENPAETDENQQQHRLKTPLQSHKSEFWHLQRQNPSSSLLVLFLVGAIYLSIDQENQRKKYVEKRRS